jgi:glycosyltransferase involved in cell wall biosynthesis
MRIAHFIHRYPPALGGSEAYFARLSRYLVAQGDEVTIYTSNAVDLTAFWSRRGQCLPAGESVENGIRVRRYPLWRWPGRRYLLKALSLVPNRRWQCLTLPCNPLSWSMWRDAMCGQDRFDAVHATAFPYAFPIVCGLQLARRLNVPFYLTPFLHLGDPDDLRDPTRRAYTAPALMSLIEAADGIFVQTESERAALLQRGIDANNIVLQGLGVDTSECTGGDRGAARARWGIGANVPVIGHLANNSEEKGTVDLLKAAALLWEKGLSFRVMLAGPRMPNFERFWKSYRHADRVHTLGPLSDADRLDFLAGLDVFALPSRSDSFGLVLLEAWANGLPNVVYRAGGPAELVHHGEDGLVVRCGDVAALADALARLLRDAGLRRQLGRAGQERACADFDWQDKLKLVRSVYLNRAASHVHKHPHYRARADAIR